MSKDYKLYDFYSLSLDSFIKILCDNLMHLMVIAGDPSEKQVLPAWQLIVDEYNGSLSESQFDEVNYYERLKQSLQMRYNTIMLCITRLMMEYDEKIWTELTLLHAAYWSFYADVDVTNKATYYNALEKALEFNKHYLSEIKELQHQLDQWTNERNKQSGESLADKKYFARMLAILSRENGYQINKKEITVAEFVEIMMLLKQKFEKQPQKSVRA